MKIHIKVLIIIFVMVLQQHIASGAKIDTLEVFSPAMQKKLKAAVALPNDYKKSKINYPVVYLLHGGGGGYKDWLTKTPDRNLIHRLCDQYKIIIIMPDGGPVSYYFDSPLDKTSQYETFITSELIEKVDATYRTLKRREGRVIAGLSMGGHGAMFLSTRHPELFCAAGSMSGVMNINTATWKVDENFRKIRRDRFAGLLGAPKDTLNPYPGYTLVTMADQVKSSGLKLILDCGVDDFLIEPNRDFHQRLLQNGTPHDYIERPGGHTWDYWENALPYQLLFFNKIIARDAK